MTEKATTLPLKSWQFYKACREILSDAFLQKLFQRELRQLQRWSADPDFAESSQRNPMDRYETVLRRLVELGRDEIARAAVSRQAAIVGCELVCESGARADKPTLPEEFHDTMVKTLEFHQAVLDGEPPEAVRLKWQAAKEEQDQTHELYLRQRRVSA